MVPVLDDRQRADVEAVADLIRNEVNVKEIKLVGNDAGILVKRVKPDFKKLGPKYGKVMKALAARITGMSQQEIAQFEKDGQFAIDLDGQQAVVELADVEIISEDIPGWLVANEGNLTVALDITVTDELRLEGIARELVNRIQNVRKSKDFDITDKITVTIAPDERTDEAIKTYGDYIAHQVLATSITIAPVEGDNVVELDMDGWTLPVTIEKV
jgi:isoleucyl-tRNA synthetase